MVARDASRTLDDIIQDPAAGTGGFLIAANRYIKRSTDDLDDLDRDAAAQVPAHSTFYGMEQVQDTHRLALMNLHAARHRLDAEASASYGDTLSPRRQQACPRPTLILTNPPFGTKKGGGAAHPRRLHLPHQQQAVLLPAAHLPRPEARRPRRRGAARQRAVRGQRRRRHPRAT